ncbi:MAG: DNA polymerase III epsilon subunit family exonuclease [Myxococcota bacterium]|jgi:DNA polymerase III epsilon subunit family exonuclease
MGEQAMAEMWFDADLAVVDVETTGLDSATDRVIEVGIIHMRAGEVIESWGRLVDPKAQIPEEVVALTGISQSDVDGQPTFEELADEIHSRLVGKVLVAYNLAFDEGFIRNELERTGRSLPETPKLDPLVFARELQKDSGSKKLAKVAERFGIELSEAHRAVNDAEVAGKVLYKFRDLLPPRLEDLSILCAAWSQQQEALMAQRRRWRGGGGGLVDTPAPQGLAAVSTEDGIVLGPAYIYGSEPDPIRFFYSQLPDAGVRRTP